MSRAFASLVLKGICLLGFSLGWRVLQAEDLPFLDLATEQRTGSNPCVQFWNPDGGQLWAPRQIVGYGLPLALRWNSRPGVAGERLSYQVGATWVRRDVTGRGEVILNLTDPVSRCTVESLHRGAGRPACYLSQLRGFPIGVRGLLPLMAAPAMREPFGVAWVGGGLYQARRCLVTDRQSHQVWIVSPIGERLAVLGKAGEPGHRDGPDPRFNGPTFLAAVAWNPQCDPGFYGSGGILADTGNHVIRELAGSGEAVTLTGAPGQAGYQDGEPRQARFREPQGLVMDAQGTIYVADRGNGAIRKLARQGPVTTLAGGPGNPGHRDGRGPQARFLALRGLTLGPDQALYVVDGHAVRRITLEGEVTTLLGVPDQAGFQDAWPAPERPGPGVPCLRDPCGIAAKGECLLLADQGNHAIREFNLRTGTLKTLAGDPALEALRPGLLRDGVPGPLGEAYAGLGTPRGLGVCESGELTLAADASVMQLCPQNLPRGPQEPLLLQTDAPWVVRDAPCGVAWLAQGPSQGGRLLPYTLDFRNADGTLALRLQGTARENQAVRREGRFSSPGPGQVVLTWVTAQGCSRSARVGIQVQ